MKKIIPIIFIVSLLYSGCQSSTINSKTPENIKTISNPNPIAAVKLNDKVLEGDFHFVQKYDDYEGSLYLKGYARKQEVNEAYFCTEDCEKSTYIFFEALPELDGKKNDFKNFLKAHEGNSFVDKKGIGIGCLENGSLDGLNNQDLNKILASTQNNPVILKLTRGPLPLLGRGAPSCYSHFHDFELQN